jgi:ubiquinone/menaquinone biosynthesis C-methylase UbiE
MNRYDRKNAAKFLNYGYEKLNGDPRLELKDIDESDRYCIQLYNHSVENSDLKGKTVLEVGCGRGGGASFISRYYKPECYVGLDITQSSIDFCNQHYKDIKGLSLNGNSILYHEQDYLKQVNLIR